MGKRLIGSIDDLFFQMYLALKRRTVRRIAHLLAVVTGFCAGLSIGDTLTVKLVMGILGVVAVYMYYFITVILILRPGFIEMSRALVFGILVGGGVSVWIGSVIIDLTFSSGVALAIIGGSLGLIWTYLNIYYYQGGER